MENKKITGSQAAQLRLQAEKRLKAKQNKSALPPAESDLLKLIHELEVHQIELELQNEELVIAKEKVEQAEEKLTILFDFAPSGYFSLSPNGSISKLNLAGAKMLGKERKNLINKRFAVFISNDSKVIFNEFLSQLFIVKKPASCEVALVSGSDIPVYAQLNGSVTEDEKQFLITTVDISKSKLAEKTLKEIEDRWHFAIEGSSDGIWDWNVLTDEVFFSNRLKQMIGFLPHELEGKLSEWKSRVHPDDLETVMLKLQQHFNKETSDYESEHRLLCKDGSWKWILDRGKVLQWTNQETPFHMFGTHTDITDRKRAEILIEHQNKELQKLNATKDKFFSIIAHDLKSPFNSIMGFSELLIEQINEKDYEGIEKYAAIILQSSHRAINLLTNLMEWSQTQTGRMELNQKLFDITPLIHDITPLFEDIALQKGIIIKKELPPNAMVFADRAMINTVLRNLISNAIKFTKPGGEIIIAVIEEKNKLTISVKDNGVGIPNEEIDKLFRIDENYSTRGTTNETGTGLGLILCKEFIEKHDKEIWVESEEGKGSVFYFTLPCSN